jgi:fibronectin type 3 domain-containing protein
MITHLTRAGLRCAPILLATLTATNALGQIKRHDATPTPINALPTGPDLWFDGDAVVPGHPPMDQIPAMPMGITPLRTARAAPTSSSMTMFDAVTGQSYEVAVGTHDTLPDNLISGDDYSPGENVYAPFEMERSLGTMSAAASSSLGTFPTSANVKLIMRFVDVTGANRFFQCSGTMVDAGVVLTAGHCLYAHAGTNGSADIYDFAAEVWVYPAWDGANGGSVMNTTNSTIIQRWGWAHGTSYSIGTDWINDEDHDRDVGIIGLDRGTNRQVGALTGWLGYTYGTCSENRTYYNCSYPVETCNSAGTLHTGAQMYCWSGTVDDCPDFWNQYEFDTTPGCFTAGWGGMSGGGLYYFDNNVRKVAAVSSTSDRAYTASYCQLFSGSVTGIAQLRDAARGNTFDLEAFACRYPTAGPVIGGGQLPSGTLVLANSTNADPTPRAVTLRVYLSNDADISTADTLLGTYSYSAIDFTAMDTVTITLPQVTLPFVASGNYFVGVILDSGTDTIPANNDTDGWDAQAITVSGCALAAAPANFSATQGTICSHTRLSWSPVPGAVSYDVFWGYGNTPSLRYYVDTTTSTFFDYGAISQLGEPLWFWVSANTSCGGGNLSPGVQGSRAPIILPATNVQASDNASCNSIFLTWDASETATDYVIYRSTNSNGSNATFLGNTTDTTLTDSVGLVPGQTYYYMVRAENRCGVILSAPEAGSVQPTITAPTGVSASDNLSCTSVQINWNAVPNATGYQIYRNTTNAAFSATLIGNAASPFFNDTTAVAGQTYWYFVRATNSCTTTALSLGDSGRRQLIASPVSSVTATDGTNCASIDLVWSPSSNATSYAIYRSTIDDSGSAVLIGTSAFNVFNDTTAEPGQTYWYFIRAQSPCGTVAFSPSDRGSRPGTLGTVTNLQATDGTTCNSIGITWDAAPNATAYEVYRSSTGSFANATFLGLSEFTTWNDNIFVPGLSFTYWVKPVNACGVGTLSNGDLGASGSSASILQQPESITRGVGATATFHVIAGGAQSYQWFKDSIPVSDAVNISGANTDTLTIDNLSAGDEGAYSVHITSPCGNVSSRRALLTVLPLPCPADFNQDGGVDGADVSAFFEAWEAGDSSADVNLDGGVDGSDIDTFFTAWEAGGC